jgi:hypothetical protein
LLFIHLCFSTNPSMWSVRLLSSVTEITQPCAVMHNSTYRKPEN